MSDNRPQPTRSEARQQEVLQALEQARPSFESRLQGAGLHPLKATGITILQLNVGRVCNQTCRHCHVSAGPGRPEDMPREVFEQALRVARDPRIGTVDITGGAPELNAHFRWFVAEARALGKHVIDRCNLTVTQEEGQEDLVAFLKEHKVEVVASLPAPDKARTDAQRGEAVFDRSILALRDFNAAGYGLDDPELPLHLVTNPVGAFLPAEQAGLRERWQEQLLREHGVRFNELYTITNMPIGRYLHWLEAKGQLEPYVDRLAGAFNPVAAERVMCRNTLSVDWRGYLYDCDFNQMLGMTVDHGAPPHIRDYDPDRHHGREIVTAMHCYGCTAGGGSSCGGALE